MTTALLIVDMLKDFIEGTLANAAAEPAVERIAALAAAARKRSDWLVVYGNDAHLPGDFELKQFGEHAMAGSEGAEVVAPLAPQERDLVVPKRYYSAFTFTDLEATLLVHNVRRLVIVGQHTDCCVRHTSYDAFLRGLALSVPSDGTAVFLPGSEEPAEARQSRALDYLCVYYGAETPTTAELLRGM
jgi:nicotinamidase-related amidase